MPVLSAVVTGYSALTTRSRIRTVRPVDRELRLRVTGVERLGTDVVGVTLADPDGRRLPRWEPGAHLDLVLPSGRLRQYSLCGDPLDRTSYRIAVRRLTGGGGGSVEVHGLRPGDPVGVRGPRNAFPFAYPHLARHDIDRVAFVAGGIGITALLPMVREASRAGTPWRLTYVGRDEATMPFLAELRALDGGSVTVLHGVPAMSEVLDGVDAATSVYFCGPPAFLDAVRDSLRSVPHAGFHFERFSPPPVVGGKPFTVRLARTGTDVAVPADTSALAAIRTVLPDVPYSCQQGFCGTCRVGVLAGKVDRRGTAAFLDAPDTMLICSDRTDEPLITIEL